MNIHSSVLMSLQFFYLMIILLEIILLVSFLFNFGWTFLRFAPLFSNVFDYVLERKVVLFKRY